MDLKIIHTTDYSYAEPIPYALQRIRMTPLGGAGQAVRDWRIRVEGGKVEASYEDHYGNRTELVSADPGTSSIRIVAEGTVETKDLSGVTGQHVGFAPLWLFRRETPLTRPDRRLRELARSVGGGDALSRLHALLATVKTNVVYEPGWTDTTTTAEEALEAGRGVCQDHAHVFLAAARLMDFPARYVSGYLNLDGRESVAESHAWAEAHVADIGWVGFDPANGISPDARYVRVATGLDYGDAAPVSGIRLGVAEERLAVSVLVEQ